MDYLDICIIFKYLIVAFFFLVSYFIYSFKLNSWLNSAQLCLPLWNNHFVIHKKKKKKIISGFASNKHMFMFEFLSQNSPKKELKKKKFNLTREFLKIIVTLTPLAWLVNCKDSPICQHLISSHFTSSHALFISFSTFIYCRSCLVSGKSNSKHAKGCSHKSHSKF